MESRGIKQILAALSLLLAACSLFAQTPARLERPFSGLSEIDHVALSVPLDSTRSIASLGRYFNAHFHTDLQKARGIFTWLVHHIDYDPARPFGINLSEKGEAYFNKILEERKGLCIDYASLFEELATRCGLGAWIVQGYTRPSGSVVHTAHAWVVARIDGDYYPFDPTWAAGFIQNGVFVRRLDETFFMPRPETFILTHFPFDYLWQLLPYPVSPEAFERRGRNIPQRGTPFHYRDSINAFLKQDEVQKYQGITERMHRFGLNHQMVSVHFRHNAAELSYNRQRQAMRDYQRALALFQQGARQFNSFIEYSNGGYQPEKPETEIRRELDETEKVFGQASEILEAIRFADEEIEAPIAQLKRQLRKFSGPIDEQRQFLSAYFGRVKQ